MQTFKSELSIQPMSSAISIHYQMSSANSIRDQIGLKSGTKHVIYQS